MSLKRIIAFGLFAAALLFAGCDQPTSPPNKSSKSVSVSPATPPARALPFFGDLHCPDELKGQADGSPVFGAVEDQLEHSGIDASALKVLCKDYPTTVLCTGHNGTKLSSTQVGRIDKAFRAKFRYRSDLAAWGKPDYWSAWSHCGDCEDYALTMAQLLAQAGQDGRYMQVDFILVQHYGGHAVLRVDTKDRGAIIVDVNSPPYPESIAKYIHVGSILMDGKRLLKPFEGYVLNRQMQFIPF